MVVLAGLGTGWYIGNKRLSPYRSVPIQDRAIN
jgi:hypothetical protein